MANAFDRVAANPTNLQSLALNDLRDGDPSL